MFGSQSMARTRFRELAGALGDGVRFPVLSATNPADLARSRFVERFSAQRHGEPDDSALLTYDATRLLLEAIRQAGPSRARVRTALAALSPWQGIAGTISFDGTGQNTRTNLQMATLRAGRIVLSHRPSVRTLTRPAEGGGCLLRDGPWPRCSARAP
jgi:branched-chain amino acid transport system substrate-binding protein